jgi:hypothetical protein
MPSAGFELAIPAGEQLQIHSLDRSATGIGMYIHTYIYYKANQLSNRVLFFVLYPVAWVWGSVIVKALRY